MDVRVTIVLRNDRMLPCKMVYIQVCMYILPGWEEKK